MAVTLISAENMPPQFSSDAGTTWKTPVCIEDWSLDLATPTTETDTFCGKFTGLGVPGGSGSANCVASVTPAAGEVSVEDVLGWFVSKTNLTFRVQTPASGTPGTDLYISGAANITGMTITGAAKDNVKYTMSWAIQGALDNTP
jgi:hypothetical protein